jgi:hypothetical protein
MKKNLPLTQSKSIHWKLSENIYHQQSQLQWSIQQRLLIHQNMIENNWPTPKKERYTIDPVHLKTENVIMPMKLFYGNIDRRFTIKKIKQILRQHNVSFNIANVSTSATTRKTLLYVGIWNPDQLDKYKYETREFFTTEHYKLLSNEFKRETFHHRHHRIIAISVLFL